MIIRIKSLGRLNNVPYEAVIDVFDKNLDDMIDRAVERMMTTNQKDVEVHYNGMRVRVKPRKQRGYYGND